MHHFDCSDMQGQRQAEVEHIKNISRDFFNYLTSSPFVTRKLLMFMAENISQDNFIIVIKVTKAIIFAKFH